MDIYKTDINLLPKITQRILSVSDPQKIILFGSFARGDYEADSDIDLLVVIDGVNSPRQESNRLRSSLRGLLVPVDVIVVTSEQIEQYRDTVGLIYHSVLKEGKVIYEREEIA